MSELETLDRQDEERQGRGAKSQNFLGSNFLCAKLSGRSVQKRFSGQALLPLTTLPKMNVLAPPP